MINLNNIRSTFVNSVDIVTIKQKRNSDAYSNDSFYLHEAIIDEWEKLEILLSSKFIT